METAGALLPANPYYARFLLPPGSTILKDALDQSPTFFLYGQEMTCCYGDSTDEITSTAII
jgi:hypothetical protein